MWNNEIIQHFVYSRKITNTQNITKIQKQIKKIENTTRKQTKQTQNNKKH